MRVWWRELIALLRKEAEGQAHPFGTHRVDRQGEDRHAFGTTECWGRRKR